jgi:hypothetical protein
LHSGDITNSDRQGNACWSLSVRTVGERAPLRRWDAWQSVGITWGYLFNAAPYLMTLAIMIATSASRRNLAGVPGAYTQGAEQLEP